MLTEELKQIADKYLITIVNPTDSYRKEHNLPSDKWLLKVIYGEKAVAMVVEGKWEEALKFANEEKKKFVNRHMWD